MYRKIFLFAMFVSLTCYSEDGIITREKRCQIATKNLELLNNPYQSVYLNEKGKLRLLTYSEILAQRAENEKIIRNICTQRVEEKRTNNAEFETRLYGEPSPIVVLRNALMSRNFSEALSLLEIANLDYSLERKIRKHIEKHDAAAALFELNEDQSDAIWGEVRKQFLSRNECEHEKRILNRARPDLARLHCEKRGRCGY